MENQPQIRSIGSIYALLSEASRRPRYAFLVLQLVAEIADERGQAGPFVRTDQGRILLRDWLCDQLMPLSEQHQRRTALRARVVASLADTLAGDERTDGLRIERAIDDQVNAVGRANISRAISDLVRAGLMKRHYAGYSTNHTNPGGGRNAVYVVPDFVTQVLPKARVTQMVQATATHELRPQRVGKNPDQGDLFAA